MNTNSEKSRILFVDDDQAILDGLRRMLRSLRARWDLRFACGGRAGLEALDRDPPDVLVTDMRMPEIDGTALLTHAQEHHPQVVRIILSGHTELESALRTLPVAHRFLTKPCDPAELESAIDRACCLNATLEATRVRRFVRSLGSIPGAPEVYRQVIDELGEKDPRVRNLARIVEQDMGLCARILQLVNSAYFSLPRQITSIEAAIAYLGTSMMKNLVLSFEAHRWLDTRPLPRSFSPHAIQRRSLLTAKVSGRLLPDKQRQEEAFTASMLIDVGQLLLATVIGDEYETVVTRSAQEKTPLHQLETEALGVNHAEVGAYLFGLWGLPYSIVEAVAYHHTPSATPGEEFDVLGAVHVADCIVRGRAGQSNDDEAELDTAYLERVGLSEPLSDLIARAEEVVTTESQP
ncbi:MAG: response regulator [Planctomycetota bacterium]